MKRILSLGLLLFFTLLVEPLSAEDLQGQVEAAFNKVRALKDMSPGVSYTVTIQGQPETGEKEKFLRRRSSKEIFASGLSSGCGDYAKTFLELMANQGAETRLIDSAQISTISLDTHNAGHVVVAVRLPGQADWWLINPTDQTVLSKKWSLQSKSFQAMGSYFWIGYTGSLADYPIHNQAELVNFYTRTLKQVPLSFWNEHLVRINFIVDATLRGQNGKPLNPNLARFIAYQADILKQAGLKPARQVTVHLVRGNDDSSSTLKRDAKGQWRGVIGLRSACSPFLFAHFESIIGHKLKG